MPSSVIASPRPPGPSTAEKRACQPAYGARRHPSPPSPGIKGAHIYDTTVNPSFFPSPTISAFSPSPFRRLVLDARQLPFYQQIALFIAYIIIAPSYTPISTGPLAAHNGPTKPRIAYIISSKAPPLPKLVRIAINATRAISVLASALESAFIEALSKVEFNASYKTILHRRRLLTLWVIIIDDVTDRQVKGDDVWNDVLVRDLRGRDGKSPI
ncbi:hypothetical protein ARMGADRAFT_1087211 [Armillaria gallica]|uniref:Uncharacterized protein n=1 Tax=Armillaria gallica TaxID=47427 RepID=A0A2H3CRG6_ARMGA|nr:hypothetical protein ARMGADRAFT_1087211 [Armillaria gallica]